MNFRNVMISGMILLIAGCVSPSGDGFIKVTVKEVEQVASYTYLLVKEKGPEYWLAVPSMEAKPGEKYKYQGGMVMQDFYSKDLDRTFDKVIFLEALFSEETTAPPAAHGALTPGSKAMIEKSDVSVEKVEGTVSIAEIYADPASFEGRTIRVRGEVTKFNPAIMDRNWAHLQDGTEFGGKFDLTLTSDESFKVGTIVTVEGVLALNMDFGYGYSYEILLEKTIAVE
jgi:hypothetical protein